jgi:hypothetical protein
MFRPYLIIFRQLLTLRNCHTALVLTSKYFNATALSLLILKHKCHTPKYGGGTNMATARGKQRGNGE